MSLRTKAEILGGSALLVGGLMGGGYLAHKYFGAKPPVTNNFYNTITASNEMPGVVITQDTSRVFITKEGINVSLLEESSSTHVNKRLVDTCSSYANKIAEVYNPISSSQIQSISEFCKKPEKYNSKAKITLEDCRLPENFDSKYGDDIQNYCSDTIIMGVKQPKSYKWVKSSKLPNEKHAESCRQFSDQFKKWVKPVSSQQISLLYDFCSAPSLNNQDLEISNSVASRICRASMKKHGPYRENQNEFTIVSNFCTQLFEAGVGFGPKFSLINQ